jgi:hypothetical protein
MLAYEKQKSHKSKAAAEERNYGMDSACALVDKAIVLAGFVSPKP